MCVHMSGLHKDKDGLLKEACKSNSNLCYTTTVNCSHTDNQNTGQAVSDDLHVINHAQSGFHKFGDPAMWPREGSIASQPR